MRQPETTSTSDLTGEADSRAFDGDPSWRVSRTLTDGTPVTVRPIFPADRAELQREFRSTSAQTRYLRFFGVFGELSDAMLDYLTDVDQKNHVAIVATLASADLKTERGVGVARFIRVAGEPDVAEAAVTVVDDMQRRGVGTVLVRELERAARAHGIKRLRADVLEGNANMRAILDLAGARCHTKPTGEGTITYEVDVPEAATAGPSPLLLAILRGAAETLAVTLRRLVPPEGAAKASVAERLSKGAMHALSTLLARGHAEQKPPSTAAADDAVLEAVALSMCADGVGPNELASFTKIVRDLPSMRGQGDDAIDARIRATFDRLERDGLEEHLRALGRAPLDEATKRQAFTAATIVQYADGRVTNEENAFLEDLGRELGIPGEEARAIIADVESELGIGV